MTPKKEVELRKCKHCQETKPITDYYSSVAKGYKTTRIICKQCVKVKRDTLPVKP